MPEVVSSAAELALRFGWPEYVVFGLMLAVSAGIGLFYGCFGGKQRSTSEFLMANRQMATFPMAMSLLASFMSAITLLGTPAEMYQYGTHYWLVGLSYFLVMPAAAYLYLPIFHRLQLTSVYEYLELRFHRSVRILGSAVFTTQMTIYMAIVVYAPALALSQVTGMNVYMCVGAIFIVCVFYTAIGGMKAVMWTDTFQVVIMFASMVAVIAKGNYDVGGAPLVFQRNFDSGRIEFFNFDPNPAVRHTFWSLTIGGYFTWLTIYGVNQAQVQRYLTVPTVRQAQIAVWINLVGLFVLLSVCCYGGLVIYAKYYDCDPLKTGMVNTPDQLFPLFVMDTLGTIPGLPGFFVAGIFSGALSTVSSGLNSLAAITLEDFIKGNCMKGMSDSMATKISKALSVLYGLLCFGLVFVAEQLGGVLQAALSIFGMVGGPLLGLFSLGLFCPWANAKGAGVGTITSLIFMFWIGFGANVAIARKEIIVPKMNVSVEGCLFNVTDVTPVTTSEPPAEPLALYHLSYMWYSTVGCWTVIIVGLIVSFLTGHQDPKTLDPNLLCPAADRLFCCIPGRFGRYLRDLYSGSGRDTEKSMKHSGRTNSVMADVEIIGKDNWAFEKGEKNGSTIVVSDNTSL